jgi:hypothetical protein
MHVDIAAQKEGLATTLGEISKDTREHDAVVTGPTGRTNEQVAPRCTRCGTSSPRSPMATRSISTTPIQAERPHLRGEFRTIAGLEEAVRPAKPLPPEREYQACVIR